MMSLYLNLLDQTLLTDAALCAALNASIPPGGNPDPARYALIEDDPAPVALFGHSPELGAPQLIEGVYRRTWTQVLQPLAQIQATLKAANLAKKIATEQAGVAYDFPLGQGVAQTRDAMDRANITGIVVSARISADNGVTDPVVPFKDAANVWHYLTPQQASTFGSAVASALLAIALRKSAVDEQIDALATAEAAVAFDLEAAWQA